MQIYCSGCPLGHCLCIVHKKAVYIECVLLAKSFLPHLGKKSCVSYIGFILYE